MWALWHWPSEEPELWEGNWLLDKLSYARLTFWHWSFTFNSNKSPIWCNNFSVYYPDVCLQLNIFRAFSCPSSGAQWLQWQPLVLPLYRGDSCAVFMVGPAGLTTNTAQLLPQYKDKTRGCQWIIHEPKKVALWNKWHFEEKNAVCSMFKILSTYSCWKKYIKCNIWRVAVCASYI